MCAVLVSVPLASVIGCAMSQTGPSPIVPTGLWGGDHINLTVGETRSRIELDCAHGEIPTALMIDSRGAFSVVGTYVFERGGPIQEDDPEEVHTAVYAGSVTRNRMQLTIRTTGPDVLVGTYTLTRGTPGRLLKCL